MYREDIGQKTRRDLQELPLELEDTLLQRCEFLEHATRKVQGTVAAVLAGAGVADDSINILAGVALGRDTDLLTALGALAVESTHLSAVQGHNHVALGELLATAAGCVAEPGSATRVLLGRWGLGGLGSRLGSGLSLGSGLGSSFGRSLGSSGFGALENLPVNADHAGLGQLTKTTLGKVE